MNSGDLWHLVRLGPTMDTKLDRNVRFRSFLAVTAIATNACFRRAGPKADDLFCPLVAALSGSSTAFMFHMVQQGIDGHHGDQRKAFTWSSFGLPPAYWP